MSGKDVAVAILSVIVGAALGYFWHYMRPADGLLTIIGVSIIMMPVVYLCLHNMGKS